MADDKERRDLFSHDSEQWSTIRAQGAIDMRFVAGDPWEDWEREERRKAGRPCLSADELGQYLNQVVNKVRSNKIGVKFSPVGNGANDKTAEFYQNKMREIEYRSRAQIGYTTAFENCVQRSFGYVRINSRYLHPKSVDQDLFIDPVHNPNLITPDAAAVMPDMSDQDHCWVREKWPLSEYNRKWPKHKLEGRRLNERIRESSQWVTDSGVFVGEFWKITCQKKKLLIVQAESGLAVGVWEDDYTDDMGPVLSERDGEDKRVTKELFNGFDALEETVDWPGKYIPIVSCFGKMIYVNESGSDKRQILSMTRLGRDPQKACAYLDSTEMEVVGLIPKFPYFVYEGQLGVKELAKLAASNHEPTPLIQVKAQIEGLPPGNGPLPFPQRNNFEPNLQAIEIARESWRRKVQAAVAGSPLPTQAQRRNEKSGVALKRIEELGEIGSYHFKDSYLSMIGMVGVIVEDLMDKVYDTPREVGVRLQNDTDAMIPINMDTDESVSTQGDHLVTVSTGQSFDSEREAGSDFANNLIGSPIMQLLGPEKGPKIFAQAVKLLNIGVVGDEIQEIIDPKPEKDGKPTPEQLQQMLAQQKGQMEQMGQALQQAQMEIQTDAAKQKATLAKAEMDRATDLQKTEMQAKNALDIQALRNAGAVQVAMVNLRGKGIESQQAIEAEMTAMREAHAHEHGIEAAGAAHEERMAQINQEAAMQAGEQGHAQSLQEGEQGHRQALEQGQQAQAGQQDLAAQTHGQSLEAAEHQASLEPEDDGS